MNVIRTPALICAAFFGAYANVGAECLPGIDRYPINLEESSVSGISSGGYMAVQFHVANSAWMAGAGIYAGGPYYCAENSVSNGIGRCMNGGITPADLQRFINEANNQASAGAIDDTENLADDRIWLFSGTRDEGVATQVMESLRDWYEMAGVPAANIAFVKDFEAGHTWPTKYYFYEQGDGNQCTEPSDYPWLGACDWESARDMLEHIYDGPLNARQSGPLSGEILEIDQASCFDSGGYGAPQSMNPKAYLYVPASCAAGESCRLHVAFHGCEMNYESAPSPYAGDSGPVYGLKFVENSGLNEIADTNNMLVLYPQAKKLVGFFGGNPKGCWDFWNYEGGGVPHTQHGKQMDAIRAMIISLCTGDECPSAGLLTCATATNDEHVSAGRAEKESWFWGWWTSYSAKGSGDDLGSSGGATTSLKETSQDHWAKVDSCP